MNTNKNSKDWEEWMGYCVHYMNWNGEGPFIDPQTDYGVPMARAVRTMRTILKTGRCAWLVKVDPHQDWDVPF